MIKDQNIKKNKSVLVDIKDINVKAIIGLGNPGMQYAKNRHNIGFRVLDALADELYVQWYHTNNMLIATVPYSVLHPISSSPYDDNKQIYFIKPQTFMNASGNVLSFLTKKGIKPEEIVVIHDELEKSLGSLAVRLGGSARGHNGLKSIINAIGQNFWRLRFGIGRPERKEQVPNYVLSNFSPQEEILIPELIEKAVIMLKELLH